jgi:hypothetical protein
MTKQTKTLLTVGGVALVAYLIYKNNKSKTPAASFAGDRMRGGRTFGRTAAGIQQWQPIGSNGCLMMVGATFSENQIGMIFNASTSSTGLSGRWKVMSTNTICPVGVENPYA